MADQLKREHHGHGKAHGHGKKAGAAILTRVLNRVQRNISG